MPIEVVEVGLDPAAPRRCKYRYEEHKRDFSQYGMSLTTSLTDEGSGALPWSPNEDSIHSTAFNS